MFQEHSGKRKNMEHSKIFDRKRKNILQNYLLQGGVGNVTEHSRKLMKTREPASVSQHSGKFISKLKNPQGCTLP